jgi:hypothetical protein
MKAAWVVRGSILAAVVVAVRVVLGFWVLQWPEHSLYPRIVGYLIVLVAAALWGRCDGARDRRAHPDPDDGADLTIRWLEAGALGAIVSGAVSWILGRIPRVQVGGQSLLFELTSGASFILLSIFLAALVGVALGRRRVDRTLNDDTTVAAG